MNGDVEGVASRPRPLSGGLWTLFNWLRRDDHSSSNESLSSVGSDRTAASFAFLAPANYNVSNTPVFLPPPSPPTDSYRKRVQERIVRRQHERDLTLHRKYGLYRSEGINSYDAFSLPPARRVESDISNKWERERRATSECFQRRVVHVPGKRRAPLPPGRGSVGSTATHYRGPRKRPAPQPPIKLIEENKESDLKSNNVSIHMNSQALRDDRTLQNTNMMTADTSEKSVKKGSTSKEAKTRLEKGFLKHIFENRKRNSAIVTSAVKILPSISELDKQAATIIENGKLAALKQNLKTSTHHQQNILENDEKKPKADNWFCVKCLRKYDSSISDCPYCIFETKHVSKDLIKTKNPYDATTSACNNYTQTESGIVGQSYRSNNKCEDKQKLKEMLKEMKDSLPKRPKHENKHVPNDNKVISAHTVSKTDIASETPTLRIGAHVANDDKALTFGLRNNIVVSNNATPLESFKSVVTTSPVVIQHEAKENYFRKSNDQNTKAKESIQKSFVHNDVAKNILAKSSLPINMQKRDIELVGPSSLNKNLQTPLRISSLLNPVYVPKSTGSKTAPSENPLRTETQTPINKFTQLENKTINQIPAKSENVINKPEITHTPINSRSENMNAKMNDVTINKESLNIGNITSEKASSPLSSNKKITTVENIKDATKPVNDLKNISDARPSTSRDILENESKIKSVDVEVINQHIKRRELINQLEKSIANGDEHAAAEAAIKLAQLRLSCSVLSFSSQIMSEPSISSSATPKIIPTGLTVATKKTSHQTEINTVIAPTESSLLLNTSTEITPVASSSQKFLQQRTTILKDSSVNDKAVASSSKNASEKMNPPFNKVSQNILPLDVSPPKGKGDKDVSISVWVEDKEATRGPIKLKTQRQAVVGDLRQQAEAALGLPSHLQRWIVGRTLCTDDNTALVTLAGSEFNAPFYLCLVETDPRLVGISQTNTKTPNVVNGDYDAGNNVYKELVQLEQQALVPNAEVFECGVCIDECKTGSGVVLRECVHMFCKDCLADVVRHSEEPDISCPAMGCSGVLQEREIRGLVSPEDYQKWLARGLAAAESGTRNAFHCRTRDCTGWALCDPGVRRFLCPVCKHSNCVPCQAIHEGETCEKYRSELQAISNPNCSKSDDSTRALLTNLINKGEALECPECKAIITKMWGCDWVKCSACKTEICWVTRGRRWGPAGRGDTSAGCRCGVDGKRCHPSCGYCH